MALEIVLLAAAFLGIAVFGLYRRGHRVFPEYSHQDNLMCVVTFYDRAETLPLIEAYFEQEYIEVRHLKREMILNTLMLIYDRNFEGPKNLWVFTIFGLQS